MNDEPVKVCPECGGDVYRLVHPVGVVFKGSGFYVTDNRAKSSTSGRGSPKKPPETSEDSGSTGKGSAPSE